MRKLSPRKAKHLERSLDTAFEGFIMKWESEEAAIRPRGKNQRVMGVMTEVCTEWYETQTPNEAYGKVEVRKSFPKEGVNWVL